MGKALRFLRSYAAWQRNGPMDQSSIGSCHRAVFGVIDGAVGIVEGTVNSAKQFRPHIGGVVPYPARGHTISTVERATPRSAQTE